MYVVFVDIKLCLKVNTMFVGSTLEAFQVVIAKQVVFYDNSIANGWNYIPNTVQVPAIVINIHVVTMKMSVYFLIS